MSIKKLKPFITVVGIMLLLASATMGYFSAQRLSSIIPASGYEDKGVYSFVPVRVLPVQVENTGATGRVPIYFLRIEVEIYQGREAWERCVDRICGISEPRPRDEWIPSSSF